MDLNHRLSTYEDDGLPDCPTPLCLDCLVLFLGDIESGHNLAPSFAQTVAANVVPRTERYVQQRITLMPMFQPCLQLPEPWHLEDSHVVPVVDPSHDPPPGGLGVDLRSIGLAPIGEVVDLV